MVEAAEFISEENPDTHYKVYDHIGQWFGDNAPSDTQIKDHIGKLCRALRVGDKRI